MFFANLLQLAALCKRHEQKTIKTWSDVWYTEPERISREVGLLDRSWKQIFDSLFCFYIFKEISFFVNNISISGQFLFAKAMYNLWGKLCYGFTPFQQFEENKKVDRIVYLVFTFVYLFINESKTRSGLFLQKLPPKINNCHFL